MGKCLSWLDLGSRLTANVVWLFRFMSKVVSCTACGVVSRGYSEAVGRSCDVLCCMLDPCI